MKVAVVGVGAMGKWFVEFAKRELGEVVVADIDSAKAKRVARELGVEAARTNEEAAAVADVIIVAVPISKTAEVLKSLGGCAKRGALLMDVASAKSDIVSTMRELGERFELVSIHPLFGPGATSVRGKDFIAVPVRRGKRYAGFKNRLLGLGARVTEMDAEEHDRLMAISQALTHFVLLSYISALKSMKGLKRAEGLRTPMFATLLELGKAMLAGNPDLFGEVQAFNRYAQLTRSTLMEACKDLDTAFAAHDAKVVRKIFEEALAIWGEKDVRAAYKRLYELFEGRA